MKPKIRSDKNIVSIPWAVSVADFSLAGSTSLSLKSMCCVAARLDELQFWRGCLPVRLQSVVRTSQLASLLSADGGSNSSAAQNTTCNFKESSMKNQPRLLGLSQPRFETI